MRMIFVNLPVTDLEASTAFYTALGFNKNPDFSDDTASCMVVSEQIYVMLLTHEKFKSFINGEIADAKKTTEVLTCLSATSRDEVDGFKQKALAAGGADWKPNMEMGLMYGCSFQDPDGHVWEVMYMDMSGD
ncbi:VOC family protein [Aliirhizobium terrae]|uniref:VOC family protein n=1 Tax=Terrirhizobium terrae TaxID=2926709 RepID=UPI00257562CA|nr:VOC family protein [Rhizobium sp. CC-CFT758]WJH41411.1 VOC family protein [Rhizobium sp. CC-CFT758]